MKTTIISQVNGTKVLSETETIINNWCNVVENVYGILGQYARMKQRGISLSEVMRRMIVWTRNKMESGELGDERTIHLIELTVTTIHKLAKVADSENVMAMVAECNKVFGKQSDKTAKAENPTVVETNKKEDLTGLHIFSEDGTLLFVVPRGYVARIPQKKTIVIDTLMIDPRF